MGKTIVQLTNYQRKKALRDTDIFNQYTKALGSKTAIVELLAKKYDLTVGAIWQVIRKRKEAHRVSKY
jgi:Mor family transcriptional regulator